MLKALGTITGIVAAAAAVGAGVFTGATLAAPDETGIGDVVRIAQGPMPDNAEVATHRTVSGIRFPDWSKQGWSARDGRGTRFADGRIAATVRYRRGVDQAALTILSGTEPVDAHDGDALLLSKVVVVGRLERGRTVVLTGWPASKGLEQRLRALMRAPLPAG